MAFLLHSSRLLSWFLLSQFFVIPAEALRHSYYTKHDERALIGPLGFPFGFTSSGHFNLTVFDFDLSIGVHPEVQPNNYYNDDGGFRPRDLFQTSTTQNALDHIDGVGFLLKRFKDEGEFNQYMNWLQADDSRCAFEPFLDLNYDDDFLLGDDDEFEYGQEDGYGEVEDVGTDGIFLNMKPLSRWAPSTPGVEYDFKKGEEGLYFLIYQICPQPQADVHSRFELDFHFSNLDVFGNESYLSSGEMALPHMFFYFFCLYAILVYMWVSNIRMIQAGGQGRFAQPGEGRPVVYPIHHLMTILLVLKTCAIFFESVRYHYIRVTGHAKFFSAVYYAFAFMKGTFLFTLILLLGSGWSFVKPFLSDREKKMVCVILSLQVINNIAIVVLTHETEGEHAFDRWTAILHMVDILCCCAVLIPIVWQVNALEKNLEQASGEHTEEETENLQDDAILREDEFEENDRPTNGRLASKLKLFRSFYLLVVGYIYSTRIIVYLFATMLDYRHTWLRHFVVETVTIAFYVGVGGQFRPMSENPYLSIRKEEDLGMAMKEVEIELTH